MAALAAAAAGHKARQRLLLALLTAAGVLLLFCMARHATQPGRCQSKALLPLKHRELFGQLLEQEGFTVGAELGVQVRGDPGRATGGRRAIDCWPPTRLPAPLRCRRGAGLPT